jgi:hypothetical protein
LGTEFSLKIIPRNRLERVSVIPQKKVLIPRHSEFRGRANSEARNGMEFQSSFRNFRNSELCPLPGIVRNGIPRLFFYFWSTEWNSELFSLPQKGSKWNYERLASTLFHGTEFRIVFSSAEGFGTDFQKFSVPRNSWNIAGDNHLFRLFRLPRSYFFVGNSQA